MINEREIAEKFSAIWRQNFPLLTPNFMRVFNEAKVSIINTNEITLIDEIRYDLVSEAAFNLAEIAYLQEVLPSEIMSNEEIYNNIIKETALTIRKSEEEFTLLEIEVENIISISNNILEFIEKMGDVNVTFRPKLKGYSFIPSIYADISIDDTLFEIKTVNRNFKSSDLKQLFIYLALNQVSNNENWKFAGLYNPRRGTYCKFNVRSLIFNLSGGKSPNEAFENFLDGLNRDLEIDNKF